MACPVRTGKYTTNHFQKKKKIVTQQIKKKNELNLEPEKHKKVEQIYCTPFAHAKPHPKCDLVMFAAQKKTGSLVFAHQDQTMKISL